METIKALQTTITSAGGLKFVARVRGHEVLTDQPGPAGGEDAAPTPLELIGVALGTCIALYVTQFCKTREIDTEGLLVEIGQSAAKRPYRIGQYDVHVRLPQHFPAEYRAAIQRAVESCAVHNTLTHPPDIVVEYEW